MDSHTDCCICLDRIKLPYKLDCNHTYCFLCLKTLYIKSNNDVCPLCRKPISTKIFEDSLSQKTETNCSSSSEVNIKWIYSGRNSGWWYYDFQTNELIEQNYQKYMKNSDEISPRFEIYLFYNKYTIDFSNMVQISSNNSYKRNIKRIEDKEVEDKNIYDIKGIAGLKIE